jgi:hypothetical protein
MLIVKKLQNERLDPQPVWPSAGNVQEWVLDDAERLFSAGGSRQDPMNRCLARTIRSHNGGADQYTGFRIVRDISKNYSE